MEKLFAEASELLATFQKEVAAFIEDSERSMLGETEADLRWKEERRAKLAQGKQNLENIPSTDTIYFLQVRGGHGGEERSRWCLLGSVPRHTELGGCEAVGSPSCLWHPLPAAGLGWAARASSSITHACSQDCSPGSVPRFGDGVPRCPMQYSWMF